MIIVDNPVLSDPASQFSLNIISSGDADCGSWWRASEPSPLFSRMYYTLDGSGRVVCGESTVELTKGRLYLIPSGCAFSHSCADSMHQLYFHVDLVDQGGIDRLRGIGRVLELQISESDLELVASLYHRQDTMSILQLRSKLMEHLTALLISSSVSIEQTAYSESVQSALKIIIERPRISMRVTDVARLCHVSADTLAHRFKQEVGVSIGRYIDELVMFRAEELLSKSDMPIAAVSAQLEFCDQFYFSRRFKERYGISPQMYRNVRRPKE